MTPSFPYARFTPKSTTPRTSGRDGDGIDFADHSRAATTDQAKDDSDGVGDNGDPCPDLADGECGFFLLRRAEERLEVARRTRHPGGGSARSSGGA